MEAIGVPSFVIPLIKGMSQVVTFEAPEEPDGEWLMGTETGKGHYSLLFGMCFCSNTISLVT